MPKAKNVVSSTRLTPETKISLTFKEWIALLTSLIAIITTIVVAHFNQASKLDKLSSQIESINENITGKLTAIDESISSLNRKIDHETNLRKLDYEFKYSDRYIFHKDSILVYDFKQDTLVYRPYQPRYWEK